VRNRSRSPPPSYTEYLRHLVLCAFRARLNQTTPKLLFSVYGPAGGRFVYRDGKFSQLTSCSETIFFAIQRRFYVCVLRRSVVFVCLRRVNILLY